MCTFGVLGLSCASPGGLVWWGRQQAHLRVPVFKNTTKIQRKGPTREGEKNEKLWREREEKARNFGPPTLWGPTLRSPSPPSGQVWPKSAGQSRFGPKRSIKVGQSRSNFSGQSRIWPKSENKDGKVGLAKVGLSRANVLGDEQQDQEDTGVRAVHCGHQLEKDVLARPDSDLLVHGKDARAGSTSNMSDFHVNMNLCFVYGWNGLLWLSAQTSP